MLHSTSQRTLGFSRLKILFDNCAGLEPACVPRNRYVFSSLYLPRFLKPCAERTAKVEKNLGLQNLI